MGKTVKEYNDELRHIGVKVRIPDNIPAPETENDPVPFVCANCGNSINEDGTTVAKAKRGDYWCNSCYPKGADKGE